MSGTDPTELAERAAHRGSIQAQIVGCTRCPLHLTVKAPVSFRGPTSSSLMLLGEAPGAYESAAGKPFVGVPGQALEQLLTDAGLPASSSWFIANAVCCWPHGTPETSHIKACAHNLSAQIRLCNPAWIVTLGRIPLMALGIKEAITVIHGRPFVMPAGPAIGRWVLPTFHPAAAEHDPARLNEIAADLSTLSRLRAGNMALDMVSVRIGRGGKVVK